MRVWRDPGARIGASERRKRRPCRKRRTRPRVRRLVSMISQPAAKKGFFGGGGEYFTHKKRKKKRVGRTRLGRRGLGCDQGSRYVRHRIHVSHVGFNSRTRRWMLGR